ncbi:AAA family ATPase [Rhizobium oryziradicis]|uniref:Nucleoside kinase n=1 Tax=Rhizobium oryziradicis TaxID=1867956 RepID=A0A1Q8ZTR1_9HYPH|nr:nucleoside kinase [Rhizobium oryziradicis]OLP45346.1 nucleoside kinase [Rhizobium oryziradicis]
MGVRNYLIEGVSCSGKTTVCDELLRRGYHAIHGDRALAYQGDPQTGEPLEGACHEHHIWDVSKVKALIGDQSVAMSFFCGGSRNFYHFIDLFDGVFVLDVDLDALKTRLSARPSDEFGAKPEERALVLRLHATREDTPTGVKIDANAPVGQVVDHILSKCCDKCR